MGVSPETIFPPASLCPQLRGAGAGRGEAAVGAGAAEAAAPERAGVGRTVAEQVSRGLGVQGGRALSPRLQVTTAPPRRLSKLCHGYVGEQGEAHIYGAHRRGPAELRQLLCHGDKGPCAGRKDRPDAPKARQNEL